MRLSVVSPFLDRQHGTEMCVIEQIERLAREKKWSIEVYAQEVSQVDGLQTASSSSRPEPGAIVWHKLSDIPGPHLIKFIWWLAVNHWRRWRDRRSGRVEADLVYTSGTNCLDADAIMVQIVFHEFFRLVRKELRLREVPLRSWPLAIHRLLYYRLIMALENRIYRNPRVSLMAVSGLTAREVTQHFGRQDVRVILNSVDLARFNPPERLRRRAAARKNFEFAENEFVALLVGNDWKKKGLTYLLQALAEVKDLPIRLLIAGRDDQVPFLAQIRELHLEDRVQFAKSSPDVMQFYAAADAYTGPSLHDSFAFPPLEAMASGLPIITSKDNGGAEVITEGSDGFVLQDPRDSAAIAQILRTLYENPKRREEIGENAARTAQTLTWERNARETFAFLTEAQQRKASA
jgi:glycosyltransferase involved in cell wall biosynthesis